MDMTFTGRGLHVTDQIRGLAEPKLAPRAPIALASVRRVSSVPAAIDLVRDKLERQLRDHHGKKRPPHRKGALGYAEAEVRPEPGPAD